MNTKLNFGSPYGRITSIVSQKVSDKAIQEARLRTEKYVAKDYMLRHKINKCITYTSEDNTQKVWTLDELKDIEVESW